MAVAKKCDRCGKYYEGSIENVYQYEENGKIFYVDSVRLGKWNARTKGWDNIVSAYDMCKDCAKEITQVIFAKGDLETRVPEKIVRTPKTKEETAKEE